MLLSVVLCAVTTLFLWWYRRPGSFPPGPRGLPILGVIPFMTSTPYVTFSQWSKKYGSIFAVRVGRMEWVVLNSYEAIMEAMVRQGSKFAARPRKYTFEQGDLDSRNHGVILASGLTWKLSRKFGESTFRNLGIGKSSFESYVQEEAKNFVEFIEKHKGVARTWRRDFSRATACIICRVTTGKRLDYTDKLFVEAITNDYIGDPKNGPLFQLAFLFPTLRFLPSVQKVLAGMRSQADDIRRYFSYEIEDHKASSPTSQCHDIISEYLIAQNEEKRTGKTARFDDSQLEYLILDLFGAGTETTTSALTWGILGLLHYPYCEKRIQAEIKTAIGENTSSINYRSAMPFTQAYIEEIHRYCTLVPLSVPHCTAEDVNIFGYYIPKDTEVMVNIWGVHHNSEVFNNCMEFRPERFLDSDGNFMKSSHVIPFGIGPRRCLGELLAKMEIFIFLTSILQRFSVRRDPNDQSALPSLEKGVFSVAHAPKPFKAAFIPLKKEQI